MSNQTARAAIYVVLLALFVGCEPTPTEPSGVSLEDSLVLPDGKFDTGYYSNLAIELEGEFTGVMVLDFSMLPEEELIAAYEVHQNNDYILRNYANDQIKLAKNELQASKLHLNLAGGNFKVLEMELLESAIRVRYSMEAESLVTHKELSELGLNAMDLVDKVYDVSVAADPRNLFERFGETCANQHGAGTLNAGNFFYYFDPELPTCAVDVSPEAQLRLHSLLSPVETYPEFDRLVEDARLDSAIFFGAAESGEPYGGDWGVMMWRTFEIDLRFWGFEKVDSSLAVGQRYQRTEAGLLETVDLFSPYDLHSLGDASRAFFGEMFLTHEIVFYNGHSFYGSLDVLDKPENYPADTYQILFMNSCWSYEYYTKQVFENKVTDTDPTGWGLADVVNNTTAAYFSQMYESTLVLFANLLIGAENGGIDGNGRHFSWQNIIGALNDSAQGKCPWDIDDPSECRFYQPVTSKHEVYGVSGVRTNTFTP